MSNYGLIITASNEILDTMSDKEKQQLENEHVRRNTNAKDIFCMFERNCINATVMQQITRKELEEAVNALKEHTTEKNISYFYFNCHGNENGLSIIINENDPDYTSLLSYQDLRDMLDIVPGKKVVMINSCHSGASISASVDTEALKKKLRTARSRMLSAFKARRKRTNIGGISLRSGELRADDYYVIASCHPEEYSFGSIFSRLWCEAAGWDCDNNKSIARVDNKSYISLKDICSYTSQGHYTYDDPVSQVHYESDEDDMCYPENSNFFVFGDTALSATSSIFGGLSANPSSKTTYHVEIKGAASRKGSEYVNIQVKLHGADGDTSYFPINVTRKELGEGIVRDFTVKHIGALQKITIKSDIFGQNPIILLRSVSVGVGGFTHNGNCVSKNGIRKRLRSNSRTVIEFKTVTGLGIIGAVASAKS